MATSEQPHRRTLPASLRLSEKAATPLGRLNLTGAITDAQHEAGQRFQVTVGEYWASIGTPGNGAHGRGYACAPRWDEAVGRMRCLAAVCECRRRWEAFEGADLALMAAGALAAVAVRHVAIHGMKLPAREILSALRAGLEALVGFYGLDRRRRT